MKKYPIETKTVEELVMEAMELLTSVKDLSEAEEIEEDAEWGYFQDEDD